MDVRRCLYDFVYEPVLQLAKHAAPFVLRDMTIDMGPVKNPLGWRLWQAIFWGLHTGVQVGYSFHRRKVFKPMQRI